MPNPQNVIGKGRRFKKGESGNPNGRPKKLPELDKLLAEVLGEEKNGTNAAEAILKAMRSKAAAGDVRAAELILNRAYGKPKETIDQINKGEVIVKVIRE